MFNFVYGTSGMIESFKMIMAMGKSIFILGAVATFVFLFYWAFNQMTGKAILLTICIMFTGIIVSAIGIGNLICISNRNIKTAIKNDYPDAVITKIRLRMVLFKQIKRSIVIRLRIISYEYGKKTKR